MDQRPAATHSTFGALLSAAEPREGEESCGCMVPKNALPKADLLN
jgi:hypothetical protein